MRDFVIDFETFGNRSNAAVIDLSCVVFDSDPEKIESFDTLVKSGKRWKFNIQNQKGKRLFSKGTIDWWQGQSDEAKANLKPSSIDVDVTTGIKDFLDFIKSSGVDPWNSIGWCRGQSFDFPILVDCIAQIYRDEGIADREIDTFADEPCKFWQQRDIRTAIESLLLTRGLTVTPLATGVLDGFVAHDSLHDCAKDVLMLKYAQRYALGLEDVPTPENTDPSSVPSTKRK